MTLTELRYIVALSHEGHFRRAAMRCHVSQPTLSVAIKKLENNLGVTLFERGLAVVKPTAVGERFVSQAEKVLAEAQQLEDIASVGRDQLSVPLRLGVIYTVAPYLLPNLVPQVHRLAPQMPLHLQENFTHYLADMLRHNQVDAIIVALPFTQKGVVARPLYDESFRVLLPCGHPLSDLQEIPVDHLGAAQLLLLGQGNCFRDQVVEACPQVDVENREFSRGLESSSLETLRYMVSSGAGISVVPASAVQAWQQRGDTTASNYLIRPFAEPVPGRRIALAWRATFPRPKVIDILCEALAQTPPDGVEVV